MWKHCFMLKFMPGNLKGCQQHWCYISISDLASHSPRLVLLMWEECKPTHEGAFFALMHLGRVWVSKMLERSDTVVLVESILDIMGSECLHMCTNQQAHKSLIEAAVPHKRSHAARIWQHLKGVCYREEIWDWHVGSGSSDSRERWMGINHWKIQSKKDSKFCQAWILLYSHVSQSTVFKVKADWPRSGWSLLG